MPRKRILAAFAEWTALSALRSGAPLKSADAVSKVIRMINFAAVLESNDPIVPAEFDRWHTQALERLQLSQPRLRNQVGWAAKIVNVYLKTIAYVGDEGRPNIRACLHPPIDGGLWRGVRKAFAARHDILSHTHCVTTIAAISDQATYDRIIGGLRIVANELGCSLIEVEQLWENLPKSMVSPALVRSR